MAFRYENDSKSEFDFPLTTDELEYMDPAIPPKMHAYFLPDNLLYKYVINTWTGEYLDLFDNAANMYDSLRYEEEAELLGKPDAAQNMRFEKVENNPGVMNYRLCFGKGEAELKNGFKYSGDMAYSLLHGKGELTGPHFRYSGIFRNSEIESDGRYEWEDCVYEGEVKRGMRNGEGTLVFNNGVIYTGQWREGLREGYGTLKYPNGQSYEGYWEKGKKQGFGVLRFASGNYYEGNFDNDLRNGQGTMNWLSTSEKYTGEWKDGKPHGFGIHVWLDPKGNKLLRNRYVGHWGGGKRHGYGVFYYANGSKYEGYWENDLKEGNGKMTFEDGTVYEGVFKNDRMADRELSQQIDAKQLETPKNAQIKKTTSKSNLNPTTAKTGTAKKPEITPLKAKEIEQNPFVSLLDLSDLINLEENPKKAEKEVQKLMLKYNSEMKSWYNTYSSNFEYKEKEEAFTMTSRQFWRFLRDCKVVSHKVTISSVNRLFLQGKKNNFKLDANIVEPQAVDNSISKLSRPHTPTLNLDISNIPQEYEELESSDEENGLMDLDLEDLHNSERPILMRQFMEGLVRVAFLKYGNGYIQGLPNERVPGAEDEVYIEKPKSILGISIYKLFQERLLPYGAKRTCKTPEEEVAYDQGLEIIQRSVAEDIFTRYCRRNRGYYNGKKDQVMEIRDFMRIMIDTSIIPTLIKENDFLRMVEKYHDTEDTFTQNKTGPYLISLLGSEITQFEFYEILVSLSIYCYTRKRADQFENVKEKVEKFLSEKLISGFSPDPTFSNTRSYEEKDDRKRSVEHSESKGIYYDFPKPSKKIFEASRKILPTPKQLMIQDRERKYREQLEREAKERQQISREDFNINKCENYPPKPIKEDEPKKPVRGHK